MVNNIVLERSGNDALVLRQFTDGSHEYCIAYNYHEENGTWGHGDYYCGPNCLKNAVKTFFKDHKDIEYTYPNVSTKIEKVIE